MKSILACSLIAMTIVGATPVLAQGVYVGPNGVGVDVGRPHRDWDRDHYRQYRDDEGRSVYRDGDNRYNRDYDER
jgi:hypothetical protein